MISKAKVAVVFGLANKRSIAWAIAQKLSEAGASLAICYQSERLQREAEELAADLPDAKTFRCDVAIDADIDAVFEQLKAAYGKLDILVHSIGFAPNIKNTVLQTTREDFRIANDISAYSLIALARAAEPLMPEAAPSSPSPTMAPRKSSPTTTSWAYPRPRSKPPSATSPPTSATKKSASTPSPPAPSRP